MKVLGNQFVLIGGSVIDLAMVNAVCKVENQMTGATFSVVVNGQHVGCWFPDDKEAWSERKLLIDELTSEQVAVSM